MALDIFNRGFIHIELDTEPQTGVNDINQYCAVSTRNVNRMEFKYLKLPTN